MLNLNSGLNFNENVRHFLLCISNPILDIYFRDVISILLKSKIPFWNVSHSLFSHGGNRQRKKSIYNNFTIQNIYQPTKTFYKNNLG